MAEHNTLSGASLHEPKGIAALTNTSDVDKTYKADGAGSGAWGFPEPKGADTALIGSIYTSDGAGSGAWSIKQSSHGSFSFTDDTVAAPSLLSASTAWTKLDDTNLSIPLVAGILEDFIYADGRLTYTGLNPQQFVYQATFSLDHAAGANRIIQLGVFGNGVLLQDSLGISEISSGTIASISLGSEGVLTTNDYVEIFCRTTNSSANLQFYSIFSVGFGLL